METEKVEIPHYANCTSKEPIQMSALLTEHYMMLCGLSKRELIAMSVMNGVINNDELVEQIIRENPSAKNSDRWTEIIVMAAFQFADEFLKQSQEPIET